MSKPVLTKAAKELAEKAIRAMRRYPRTINMNDWIQHNERVKGKEPYCGTTACIAGHIALAAGAPKEMFFPPDAVEPKYRKYASVYGAGRISPSEFVESVFGVRVQLGTSDVGGRLFFKERWPVEFRKPYNAAKRDHKERARVTIARFRHWLKTGK